MSITSRINEMSSHIEQAYDELQGLGADLTNVNKNIENISMVLDDIYDSLPSVSGEGTSLTLDDTRVGKIKSTLKGNTSQDGTPTPSSPIPVNVVSGDNEIEVCGKNLFDKNNYVDNYYISADGSLTYQSGDFTGEFISVSTGKYIASIATNAGNLIRCAVYDKNKNFIRRELVNGGLTLPITISDNEGFVRISAYKSSLNSMQLEKGESTSTYEPYQGNTYNIDLPVENLFNKSTATLNKGVSSSTGSLYNNSDSFATDYIPIQNGKSYTMNSYSSSNVCFGALYDSSKAFLEGFTTSQNNKTVTINNANAKYIRITGQKVNIDTYQLEKGTKANSYTPYGTTPIELCKIGNYQDYFYKDSGKWYLHKEIGKVVLNGSENWGKSSKTQVNRYFAANIFVTILNASSIDLISNYFVCITPNQSDSNNIGLAKYNENGLMINFSVTDTNFDTLEKFKTWLSSHNVVVYYVLATPVNTALEDM